MRTLNLSTASAWDIGIALESERMARLDDYLDDRDPRWMTDEEERELESKLMEVRP